MAINQWIHEFLYGKPQNTKDCDYVNINTHEAIQHIDIDWHTGAMTLSYWNKRGGTVTLYDAQNLSKEELIDIIDNGTQIRVLHSTSYGFNSHA